jgi:hypothetical protein
LAIILINIGTLRNRLFETLASLAVERVYVINLERKNTGASSEAGMELGDYTVHAISSLNLAGKDIEGRWQDFQGVTYCIDEVAGTAGCFVSP